MLAAAWPVHTNSLILTGLAVLVGLPVLGVAAVRSGTLRPGWRWIPLSVGVLWIALFIVGEVIGDVVSPDREVGFGFVPVGLAWTLLGLVILDQWQVRASAVAGSPAWGRSPP